MIKLNYIMPNKNHSTFRNYLYDGYNILFTMKNNIIDDGITLYINEKCNAKQNKQSVEMHWCKTSNFLNEQQSHCFSELVPELMSH